MEKRLKSQQGLTLIELVMVIIIIGILAGVAMKSMDSVIETGRVESTKTELNALAKAIAGDPDLINNGTRADFGYVGDVGSLPPDLDALISTPGGFATWNGPYISSNFTQTPDDFKKDAWGVLYIYGGGTSITSTGSGSTITRQFASAVSDLTSNTIQGSVMDAEGIPPGIYSTGVNIVLEYPDGAGAMTSTAVNPSPNGNYSISGLPIGHHIMTTVNTTTGDTVVSYVTVLPKSSVVNNIRFGSALWGAGNSSSGSGLQYVTGSAVLNGTYGQNIYFQIYNNTGANVSISWIKVTYDHVPAAYFERVRWGSNTVANRTNPRYGSGDQVDFSSTMGINNGSSQTIRLERFRDAQTGSAGYEYMNGTNVTIMFSDNSEITFSI
nr:prepilin-type N-terminal cleavage/methylation domain-containing protein [candidate division Zixibacteria bacterium]